MPRSRGPLGLRCSSVMASALSKLQRLRTRAAPSRCPPARQSSWPPACTEMKAWKRIEGTGRRPPLCAPPPSPAAAASTYRCGRVEPEREEAWSSWGGRSPEGRGRGCER
ncbi:unnamed protein product [Urochloa humidicola]